MAIKEWYAGMLAELLNLVREEYCLDASSIEYFESSSEWDDPDPRLLPVERDIVEIAFKDSGGKQGCYIYRGNIYALISRIAVVPE